MKPATTSAAGALVSSTLYLGAVVTAALVTNHPIAWKLAITAIGVTFFSWVAQIAEDKRTAQALVLLSWAAGATAGIALLF